MRFKLPRQDDTRIKTRFLFFPKTIGYEKRWLEFATWYEKYYEPFWESESWIDDSMIPIQGFKKD